MSTSGQVTQILRNIEQGDGEASERLLPLVYHELRRLATDRLNRERPGQTLQPTALVHEAYLRLVSVEQQQIWNSRGHFFAAAAEAMRRILVENARRKQSLKRGGHLQRVDVDLAETADDGPADDLVALDEALSQFEEKWPDKARLVKLRYFAGLTIPEAARSLKISTATAERHWRFARAWLHAQLNSDD